MLRVVSPGLQTTVQDLGRVGLGRYGVPTGGALDTVSLRLANLLLGNDQGSAALEMTLVGPVLEALGPVTCVCTGADMEPSVNGSAVAPGAVFRLRRGDVLRFGRAKNGARAYLGVRGGLASPLILGSRSVLTAASYGSFGRALREGDVLHALPTPAAALPRLRPPPTLVPTVKGVTTLRATRGPQARETGRALDKLLGAAWKVASDSSRVGLRLTGPSVPVSIRGFSTEGAPVGSVQLTPAGQPILLLAEGPVTGGYPKPLVVIGADLPLAGQLGPGDAVRFRLVTVEAAVEVLRAQESALSRLSTPAAEPTSRLDPVRLRRTFAVLESSSIGELRVEHRDEVFHWERGRGR